MLQRFQLEKFNLNMIETNRFKTNYLAVNFIMPLNAETASLNALLPMVLKRGCKAFPNADSLNDKLNELYGARLDCNIRKRGEAHVFGLSLEFIGDNYALFGEEMTEKACVLMAEILCNPKIENGHFDERFVGTEKGNLKDAIESELSDKRTYALNRCIELMCQNEPYGINRMGSVESVEKITPEDLYQHYKTVISQAQIELFFIGTCPGMEVPSMIERAFALLPQRNVSPPVTTRVSVVKEREITEQIQATQGKLVLGIRSSITAQKEENYPLSVFNALYGGSVISKLFVNVREKLSLCYYCSSFLEKHKGLMMVSSGVENDKRMIAQKQILAELAAVKAGEFTENELDAAIKTVVNNWREAMDSAYRMEDWQLGQILEQKNDMIEDAILKVGRVTRDEVVSAANSVVLDMIYFLEGVKE